MRPPTHKRLCSLSLSVLLFLPAMPALAQEASAGEGGIDLHLAEALDLQGAVSDEGFGIRLEGDREAVQDDRSGEVDWMSLREVSWQVSEQAAGADPAEQAKPEKKGFGRWLKKHWYVPVLAGVALGVALSDDDDDADEDDD